MAQRQPALQSQDGLNAAGKNDALHQGGKSRRLACGVARGPAGGSAPQPYRALGIGGPARAALRALRANRLALPDPGPAAGGGSARAWVSPTAGRYFKSRSSCFDPAGSWEFLRTNMPAITVFGPRSLAGSRPLHRSPEFSRNEPADRSWR